MRITSQDETVDANYDMCTLTVNGRDDRWQIEAWSSGGGWYRLGIFPTEIAAKQELTRIYESWKMGCANHQVRKVGRQDEVDQRK